MNDMINDKNVMQWIERFLAAETTCEQERQLYNYFSRTHIPTEAMPYREMMLWYASGMQNFNERNNVHRWPSARVWWRIVNKVASVIVLVAVGVSVMYNTNNAERDEDYLIYEGSYVIRNGEKITDLDEILPDLKKAESYVANQSISVPSTRQTVNEAVLENFDDEQTREIVARVLLEY